jgi:hypothetical protein
MPIRVAPSSLRRSALGAPEVAHNVPVRHLLAIGVLTFAMTGCDDRTTYSTEEVVAAFQRQSYTLVPRELPGEARAPGEGDLLTPRAGQPFIVIVVSDAVANEAWGDYETQQTHESFDVRRANVVVISDSGLAAHQRARVVAAMSALPDRGAAVVVAGRQ